jgi:tRNA (guanine37-N1)-methyltransferase
MRIDIVTIFPGMFDAFMGAGLLGKAVAAGTISLTAHDLRRWGVGRHRSVDDEPYGGGAGMVLRPEPFFEAVDFLRTEGTRVVLLSPRGRRLDHATVVHLASVPHLVLLCGRYEGVDERVSTDLADEEISIGDYVLQGGELPAMVVVEAVSRHVAGVLGNPASTGAESHAAGELEHPHYTRPPTYRGLEVPRVLVSGDHGAIERWRRDQAKRVTEERRPDLLGDA